MPTADTPPAPAPGDRCPCLSGEVFGACCGPFLGGSVHAPTAVQLMRSRYSAFVVGDAGYLLATWHPSTRPTALETDASLHWYRLDIVRTERGGPLDISGVVEFVARYRTEGDRGELHETSRFAREGRRWYYVDGDV
ncbi:SEC-C domain-containing protein [Agromyces sp. SYSU K20354]|uniref:YchJ family protein n=1 Tax=Agromyces cavernae TaxID=2898659 RepID=UPI001E2E6BAA|nr:YchJ family metal-binding protein [Agromyces cavernae]MCD2441896.1 SEC-C domain-containing protein [Agromyces cavernae]